MRLWKNGAYLIAVADEGKAFRVDDDYVTHVKLMSESEADALVEVRYRNEREVSEEEYTRLELLHELKEINEWFLSTDYIPNKVLVGEWEKDDPRFVEYCEKRKKMRARQDEIHVALGLGGLV